MCIIFLPKLLTKSYWIFVSFFTYKIWATSVGISFKQSKLIDINTSNYLNRSGSITNTQFYEDSEINKKFTCCAWDEVKSTGLENCCWGGAPTAFAPEPGTGAAEVAETPIGVGACCEGTPVDCAVACWPCWAPPTCACCWNWVCCWGGCCA